MGSYEDFGRDDAETDGSADAVFEATLPHVVSAAAKISSGVTDATSLVPDLEPIVEETGRQFPDLSDKPSGERERIAAKVVSKGLVRLGVAAATPPVVGVAIELLAFFWRRRRAKKKAKEAEAES